MRLREVLALCVLLLTCLGFEWPGRVLRIERELRHGSPAERRAAARMLGGYPGREPGALLQALEDDDREVRSEAAAAAGRVRARGAAPILLDWLTDPDPASRIAALSALGQIGDATVASALSPALSDVSPQVRREAVMAIEATGADAQVIALRSSLRDADPEVRAAAARALGERHAVGARAALQASATDRDSEVRAVALRALGQVGGAGSVAVLARALASDREESVRLAAAAALGALGALGEGAAVPALSASLQHGSTRLGEAAVAALGGIDHESARRALVAALSIPALQPAATLALVHHARRLTDAASWATRAPSAAPETGARRDPRAPLERLIGSLASALAANAGSEPRAIAEALAELAGVTSIESALPALTASLRSATAENAETLVRALAQSGDDRALPALLDRLARGDAQQLPAAVDAVQRYLDARAMEARTTTEASAAAGGLAVETALAEGLLACIDRAAGETLARIMTLLGRLRVERVLPALVRAFRNPDQRVRLAAIRASAELAAPGAAGPLLALLDSPDSESRLEAALSLRTTADLASLQAIVARLERAETGTDLHAALLVLGGGLRRMRDQGRLPSALASSALAAIGRFTRVEDRGVAARAVDALGVWGGPDAVSVLAGLLRRPSPQRRVEAIAAIGRAGDSSARPLLRYVLLHSSMTEAAAAATALGDLGDRSDAPLLMRASVRLHWPARGATAYAMLRLTQRGALSHHSARRALCELAASREPHVRGNAVAGLALLGAAPCARQSDRAQSAAPSPAPSPEREPEPAIDPLRLLDASHTPIVRAAAARWSIAAARAERIDRTAARTALMHCAAADRERSVRAACSTRDSPGRSDVAIHVLAPDRVTPLRDRLVSVQSSDGAVYLGTTDANGLVRVSGMSSGPITLQDPTLATLEP
jgi:HEAT repeat protein